MQCGRPRFDPSVGKIPWRRNWQPTPVLLLGDSQGWRSLAGYSSLGCKESDTTEQLTHTHTHTHTAASQAPLSSTVSWSLLKTMSIESVMPSNHLILCCPLHIPPSIVLIIRVFSNVSALRIRWPKYWSFNFNISPANEHLGLISFRIDWFDVLGF